MFEPEYLQPKLLNITEFPIFHDIPEYLDTTSTVRLQHTVNMNSNRAIENLNLSILKGLSTRAMAIMALRDAAMAVRVA